MFLSLKGAIGRNPMINRVGQRLLQAFEGASAAYSLRDLASNIASVVRVRRASDNSEADFSAADVSSGAMTQWVNAQIVPPLDVRELVDGERTGDLVEAAAAYSLRNLSSGGTSLTTVGDTQTDYFSFTGATGDTAALNGIQYEYVFPYNGAGLYNSAPPAPENSQMVRNTDGSWLLFIAETKTYARSTTGTAQYPWDADWTGTNLENATFTQQRTGDFVVQVRRSSDGETKSFTAAEVADGTLEDWVTDVVTYESDFSVGKDGWYATHASTVIAADPVGTDNVLKVTVDTSSLPKWSAIDRLTVGHSYSIQLEVYVPSSNANVDGIVLMDGSGSMDTSYLGIQTDSWVTISTTGIATISTLSVRPADGTRSSAYSGFQGNGTDHFYVRNVQITDTSDNGFVKKWYDQSGNGNHATQTTNASQPKIVDGGSLVTRGGNSKPSILFGGAADNYLDVVGRPLTRSVFSTLQASNTNFETLICDTTDNSPRLTTNNAANNRAYKLTGFGTPSVNIDGVTYNGTSSVSSFGFHLLGMTSVTGSEIDRIGANPAVSATGNSFNFVSELILYPDDQSDNRTALEANIGETYNIDLPSGVDTGYDQVDGFVETWYDQSGNGNDAVQQVSGSQPKIVDAGVLVSGGIDFDGVDDRLACPSLYSSDISVFNVVTTSNTVNTNNYMRMIHLCDGSDSFQLTRGGSTEIGKLLSKNTAFQSGTTAFRHGDINGENLISAITSSTDTDAYIDGSLQPNDSTGLGSGNDTTTTIGARDDLLSSSFFAGSHAEIIIYDSDQSANREAIEANINNQYDIY